MRRPIILLSANFRTLETVGVKEIRRHEPASVGENSMRARSVNQRRPGGGPLTAPTRPGGMKGRNQAVAWTAARNCSGVRLGATRATLARILSRSALVFALA